MSKMITARIDEELLAEVDRERRRLPRATVMKQALALWVEQRRLEKAVRRHGQGYQRFPVSASEFGPLLGAQRWPR